jgi:hypothetical protein
LSAVKSHIREKFDIIPSNEESIRLLTSRITKRLSTEAVQDIDEVITVDELRAAVNRGNPNKAPGEEGITHDFFKLMWHVTHSEQLEIVNQMYDTGITNKQQQGVTVCVPKAPRPTRPNDYHHLTLLNADVRLLTSPSVLSFITTKATCRYLNVFLIRIYK